MSEDLLAGLVVGRARVVEIFLYGTADLIYVRNFARTLTSEAAAGAMLILKIRTARKKFATKEHKARKDFPITDLPRRRESAALSTEELATGSRRHESVFENSPSECARPGRSKMNVSSALAKSTPATARTLLRPGTGALRPDRPQAKTNFQTVSYSR